MKEIKVVVTYSEGYEKRFTQACLEELRKRNLKKEMEKEAVREAETA